MPACLLKCLFIIVGLKHPFVCLIQIKTLWGVIYAAAFRPVSWDGKTVISLPGRRRWEPVCPPEQFHLRIGRRIGE